ncbi:kinase-like domain-containing protein, partial [Baffinella frigidus]
PPVIHRDVKPENLLLAAGDVSRPGAVKLCDFGLARTRDSEVLNMTTAAGTLSFIAPEVHRGEGVDEKCDVYALAILTWELASLQRPF